LSCEAPTFVAANKGDEPSATACLDIVFLHGLTGNRFTSWSDTEENFWPKWLAADFPACNVYTAGYDTDIFVKLLTGPGASIQDIAVGLAESLASRPFAAPSVMFVTHSLGGLVVKQMIRKCCDSADVSFNDIARGVRGVAFLATPHQGAHLAKTFDTILHHTKSIAVQQLAYSNDTLVDLHEFFRTWATKNNVAIKPYYETQFTWGVHVVDKVTANPNVYGADPIAIQADHIGICKPASRTGLVFVSITKMVEKLIQQCGGSSPPMSGNGGGVATWQPLPGSTEQSVSPGIDDQENSDGSGPDGLADDILVDYQFYTTTAPDDRRNLAKKLSDAGRSYLVGDAERKKERFNMALRRNIALPAAVTRYTKLMADVETRFNRHVVKLIVDGAPPTEIDNAIQTDIVNPCSTIHSTIGHEISASLVDSAIYYLAGNCHVRWDNGAA
jgi:triacylglycerol esterase/lipase EstA (alpha/beta hydrolase family)